MLSNDWHLMPPTAWAVMAGCLLVGALLSLFLEWLGKPRRRR
jgi:hypothetical protein